MGQYVRADGLILNKGELIGFQGPAGRVRLFTTEQVRQILGYSHVRHIYWLIQQGHLPLRKFGRELVFTESDIEEFQIRRGY